MDLKSAAQVIRDSVSMEQILDFYGYRTKHGFMVCPFHGDRDPSLKVYSGRDGRSGWHCFGCGRGGSVIDFVKDHENCSFRTAVLAISKAMHLNLFPADENPYEAEEHRRKQEKLDLFVRDAYRFCDEAARIVECGFRTDIAKMKKIRDKPVPERTAEEWTFLETFGVECEYKDYLLEKIDEFREEVAAWRRKERKVRSA